MPLVFSAATILAKDPKTGDAVPWNPSPQRWIDGSVDNDLPMTRLAEMFNVNHFIVSQVNPHVVPFLVKEEKSITQEAQQSTSTTPSGPSWLHNVMHLAKDEALHRMRTMADIGIFPNALTKAISVLSQKYSGDITIFPQISYSDFPRMLSNPTPEFMGNALLCGERATWPKLSRVRNHCAIELALDDAVQKLRARVVFSPSQVDLRVGIPLRSRSRKEIKGTLRERPLSQSSAPVTAPPEQSHTFKISKGKTHRKTRSVTRPQDVDDLLTAAASPSLSMRNLSVAETSNDLDKLTSSGADETSNLPSSRNSSSSTLSASSPLESPCSPISSPIKATHGRPLFLSSSQPATPSRNHGWSSTPNSKAATPPQSTMKDFPTMPTNFLTMTPKSLTQSPAESKYKRLFHPPMVANPESLNDQKMSTKLSRRSSSDRS